MSLPRIALVVLVAVAACSTRPADPAQDLERRILAPCCYRQTLEDHESDIAHKLRDEIQRRVAAREPVQTIEADLVHRYGSEVLAMPTGTNPRVVLGVLLAATIALGGLAIARMLARKARPAPAPRIAPSLAYASELRGEPVPLAYADRLADELVDVD